LQYVRAENPPKVIAITSAVPGEGKTSTSLNLAISFATSGMKTLLIEADMRRPKLNEYMRFEKRRPGLSEMQTNQDPYSQKSLIHTPSDQQPDFEGGAGHGKPLAAVLAECFQGSQPHRIEYHCDDRSTFTFFTDKIRQMEGFLPPIPSGFRIRFIRWRSLPDGDSPHPRYILTDRGGLRYDYGLSEEDGKTTDIGILGPDVYARRWSEYSASGTAFEFVDGLELRNHKLAVLRKDGSVFVTGPGL
jgi:hypothetical protein